MKHLFRDWTPTVPTMDWTCKGPGVYSAREGFPVACGLLHTRGGNVPEKWLTLKTKVAEVSFQPPWLLALQREKREQAKKQQEQPEPSRADTLTDGFYASSGDDAKGKLVEAGIFTKKGKFAPLPDSFDIHKLKQDEAWKLRPACARAQLELIDEIEAGEVAYTPTGKHAEVKKRAIDEYGFSKRICQDVNKELKKCEVRKNWTLATANYMLNGGAGGAYA